MDMDLNSTRKVFVESHISLHQKARRHYHVNYDLDESLLNHLVNEFTERCNSQTSCIWQLTHQELCLWHT